MDLIFRLFGLRTVKLFMKSGSVITLRCKTFSLTQRNCKVISYEATEVRGYSPMVIDLEEIEAVTVSH